MIQASEAKRTQEPLHPDQLLPWQTAIICESVCAPDRGLVLNVDVVVISTSKWSSNKDIFILLLSNHLYVLVRRVLIKLSQKQTIL